ncbi:MULTISPECIES: pleiotropic regulatory protein RsmS [Photorhabdus]|uniref:Pleiotropic regulatory protein RsmS n=1 Tax=Photorhabdus bodei TaxID=2029681 RepID=A0AAW6BG41_9GAMM|nr:MULTISPECIES: pleiotropic regulatory protein RsmS [Photorhabdus]MCC8465193.1 pleiotropic regulatory protein RsmS [Photorhabdus bodei]MCT8351132.1 pleiotropic regulatory protein RsmS [Photorhabdus kayaii]MDB6370557.1 pleiotropic regulatory protein RsmS [Photorhabdus bodei]
MSVEHAPPEVQLAVDLIYLLECNEIAPEIALAALEIVKHDYQAKLAKQSQSTKEC